MDIDPRNKQLMGHTKSRILMLLENNPYPHDTRVRKEAVTLCEAGYDVTVICQGAANQPKREMIAGVRVYRYPAAPEINSFVGFIIEYGYAFLAAFVLTFYVFIRHGFDVIHAHNPPDIYVFVALVYKLLGKKFVFDHHDLTPEVYNARYKDGGNPLVYRVLLWMEKVTCFVADHVMTTNGSYQAVVMERGGVLAKNITIVRNGPDPQRLRPVAPDPVLRQRGGTILTYAGAMGVQDGLDYLLRALFHLRFDYGRLDFYCVIMGDGEELEALKKLASDLQIADHVWFPGWISGDAYVRYLASADICVDPDPSNPFNDRSTMIKMMEYMAMEKPIVAFDLPEHRYTAQGAALYVPDNDERLFAEAIGELMDDGELREQMGRLGRKRIEDELAWEYAAAELIKAYQKILPLSMDQKEVFYA